MKINFSPEELKTISEHKFSFNPADDLSEDQIDELSEWAEDMAIIHAEDEDLSIAKRYDAVLDRITDSEI